MTKFAAGPRYKDPVSGTEWANEHTFHIANWMLNNAQIYQEMKSFCKTLTTQFLTELGLSRWGYSINPPQADGS